MVSLAHRLAAKSYRDMLLLAPWLENFERIPPMALWPQNVKISKGSLPLALADPCRGCVGAPRAPDYSIVECEKMAVWASDQIKIDAN